MSVNGRSDKKTSEREVEPTSVEDKDKKTSEKEVEPTSVEDKDKKTSEKEVEPTSVEDKEKKTSETEVEPNSLAVKDKKISEKEVEATSLAVKDKKTSEHQIEPEKDNETGKDHTVDQPEVDPNTNSITKDGTKHKEAEKDENRKKTLDEEPKKKRKRYNSCTSSCSSDCTCSDCNHTSGSESGSGGSSSTGSSPPPAKKSKQEEDDKSTSGAEDDSEPNETVQKPIKNITLPTTPIKKSTSVSKPIVRGKETDVKWLKKSTDRLPLPKSRDVRIQEYMHSIGSSGVSAKISSSTPQPDPLQKTVDDILKVKKSTTDKAKSKSKSDTSADKEKKDKKKMPLESGEKNIKNVEDEDKVDESNKPPEGYDEVPDKEFEKLYKGEHSQNFHRYVSGYCLTVI